MKTFLQECAWLYRHKGALLILLGAPLLYAVFYPLPYQHAVVDNIPIIIWDDENTAQTRDWSHYLDAHPKLNIIAVLPGEPSGAVWLTYPQAQAFIHFPKGLTERIAHQQQVNIPYGGKADNFLVYSTAIKSIALTLQELNQSLSLDTFYREQGNSITASMMAEPIDVNVVELFNSDASYMQYLVPSVFILIVQQVLMITLGMHWGYRFEMKRPLGDAFKVWQAHIIIYSLQGLALIAFFFQFILPWQGVPFTGSSHQLFAVSVPFVLSVVGFAMVISIGFREQESAIIWLLPISVPFMLMAGVSWPEFAMSSWIQALAAWIPSTWGINALIDVAFIGNQPDLVEGWRNALIWLSLGFLLRRLVVDKAQAVALSTA